MRSRANVGRVLARLVALAATTGLIVVGASGDAGRPATAIPGPAPGPFQVALTFDDGPASSTPRILDILAEREVPATFFVLGMAVDTVAGEQLVGRMHTEGHSVQNHSNRHPYLSRLSADAVSREIGATSRSVERCTGTPTTCFRPPYGATSERVRANALGHHEVMWTADSRDFLQPGIGSIVANSLRGADGRGMIVLLHDGGGNRHQTVAALPFIIDAYRARGYEFVNLCRAEPITAAARSGTRPPTVRPVGETLGIETVAPVRILDTRIGPDRVGPESSTAVPLPASFPVDAVAVVAQLTAVDPAAAGWLASQRCGATRPTTSSLNVDPAVAARSSTTIAPVTDGSICVFSSVETHLLVDVTAALVPGPGLGMQPVDPQRVFDSRTTGAPLPTGTVTRIELPGRAAALLNVTATDALAGGHVTAWPCDQPRPETSILNQAPCVSAVAASTILPLGAEGDLCVVNEGGTGLIVDLVACDDDTGTWRFQLAEPVRLLDTRTGIGEWSGKLLPGQRIDVETTLPPGVLALVTVTVTQSDGPGYLVVWDGSDPMPPTSSVNHDGLDVANLAGVTLGADARLVIRADGAGSTHVLVDLFGWFTPPT